MKMDAQIIREIIEESGIFHAEMCFEESLSQLGRAQSGIGFSISTYQKPCGGDICD